METAEGDEDITEITPLLEPFLGKASMVQKRGRIGCTCTWLSQQGQNKANIKTKFLGTVVEPLKEAPHN